MVLQRIRRERELGREMMSGSKVFNSNYDFMHDYSTATLGENRGKWRVCLKNKSTSLVEAFMVPASEEGGLRSLEDYQFVSWEELAGNYTFIDDTPCVRS